VLDAAAGRVDDENTRLELLGEIEAHPVEASAFRLGAFVYHLSHDDEDPRYYSPSGLTVVGLRVGHALGWGRLFARTWHELLVDPDADDPGRNHVLHLAVGASDVVTLFAEGRYFVAPATQNPAGEGGRCTLERIAAGVEGRWP